MDRKTLSLLQLIANRESASMSDIDFVLGDSPLSSFEPIQWLLTNGYIEHLGGDNDMSPESTFCVTHKGKMYLNNRNDLDKKTFWKEFRAWFTLAIALAAFIKSFFL